MTADELRAAMYCCAEVIRSRRRLGAPVPSWLHAHHAHLMQLHQALGAPLEQSEVRGHTSPVLISAREAAAILGTSKSAIHRLAGDLGGRLVDGRYVFMRNTVENWKVKRDA